ncbi:hypothetical protein BASA83_003355 [Batrachochytrium salamandrivorans]|nr:hypothetical protein BASA83_003355 [Batrachochytrium salamandrivorans]
MFSRIKAWGKSVLKIFKPCGISSLSEGGFDRPFSDYPGVPSSAYLPNDPDRIYSESDIRVESVPMATIHKTRSDTLEAANPIALATEKSASDMVISGCQTQQDSIKAKSAKIKEKMDSGVDIAKELYPIKDFAYDDSDQFIFKSYIAIDGIHDVPTKCIVVYDKSNRLKIHEIADGTVSPPLGEYPPDQVDGEILL